MFINNPKLEIVYWVDITGHDDEKFEKGGLTNMIQTGFVVYEDDKIIKISHSTEMPVERDATLTSLSQHDYFTVPKGVIKKRVIAGDFERYLKKLR